MRSSDKDRLFADGASIAGSEPSQTPGRGDLAVSLPTGASAGTQRNSSSVPPLPLIKRQSTPGSDADFASPEASIAADSRGATPRDEVERNVPREVAASQGELVQGHAHMV